MDAESKKLAEDCFLRPIADARATNIGFTPSTSQTRLKVELQVLRLSDDAQDMIMNSLKSIHGEDFRLADITNYKDKGGRIKTSYWEDRGTLLVHSVTDYSNAKHSELTAEDQLKRYAILKLGSYGFSEFHCSEALEHCKGDVSKALELLYSKYMKCCFDKHLKNDHDDFPYIKSDLLEMREDEKMVLESIYDKVFEEKEKNSVWSLKFKLDYLLIYSPTQVKKLTKRNDVKIEITRNQKKICRNILKGNCKYGDACRFSHDIEEVKKTTKNNPDEIENDQSVFNLEIRFPENTRYPYQPPMIFLKSNCPDIPCEILLKISRKLYKEAEKLANDGMPSIYTLSEFVQLEEEMLNYIKNDYESFPDSKIPLLQNENDIQNGLRIAKKNFPSHYMKGSTGNTNRDRIRPEQILRENQILIQKFLEKNKHEYYRKMLKIRQDLPAWNTKNNILEAIKKSQVVVISGETGCGKSTQVPQFILDDWLVQSSKLDPNEISNCEIICTQPRRLSAIGVAERVADERNEKIGQTVGYQIRLESKISSLTRLTFCTTGILLQRLRSDPLLESVNYIIVDEVHERSEESDFLLLILRKILNERKDLKIILMSATLNAKIFSDYFENVPVLEIPGRTFPVQQFFLEDILEKCKFVLECDSQFSRRISKKDQQDILEELEFTNMKICNLSPSVTIKDESLNLDGIFGRYNDYSKSTGKTIYLMNSMKVNPELIESILNYIVYEEHDWPKEGSILIFLPGLAEIQTVHDALSDSKLFGPRTEKFVLIPLHSTLTNEEQTLVFQKVPKGKRKIILSTNIAETSVTIDDCVFVIDTGLMKEKRYDPNKKMESLDLVWISRANALQRKGRAGRVMPGVCIHLFTSNRYSYHILKQPVPEIHRVPLEQLLLRIKTLQNFGENDILEIINETIEPPTEESVSSAINRLQDVGAFDNECNLTALGHHLSLLPVDVRIGKFLLFGAMFQCVDSVLTIAACLSHKSPFVSPFNKKTEADRKKKSFSIFNSDHLTVLNAYKKWLEVAKKNPFSARYYADENFLSWRTLETIVDIKHQFLELLVSIGFIPLNLKENRRYLTTDNIAQLTGHEFNANGENSRLLISLLCAALYPNVVKVLTPEKIYTKTIGGAMPRIIQSNELKFKTREDGYVSLHPSSVNSNVGYFQSPFLLFQEKVKTSKIFIRECSMVPLFPLVFFSGSNLKIELHSGDFLVLLDNGWIMLKAHNHETAEMVHCLRQELVKLLEEKIRDPCLNLLHHDTGKKIIATIVHLVSKE